MPSICISLLLHIVVVLNTSPICDDYKLFYSGIFLNESCYFVFFLFQSNFHQLNGIIIALWFFIQYCEQVNKGGSFVSRTVLFSAHLHIGP